jgi:hypothetical protein
MTKEITIHKKNIGVEQSPYKVANISRVHSEGQVNFTL